MLVNTYVIRIYLWCISREVRRVSVISQTSEHEEIIQRHIYARNRVARVHSTQVNNVLLVFFFFYFSFSFFRIHRTPNTICAPCASKTKDDHVTILTPTHKCFLKCSKLHSIIYLWHVLGMQLHIAKHLCLHNFTKRR